MRKNTRYLWIYTGILFSIALILIIFAYFTQSNDKFDLETHGMKQSVTQLIETNKNLQSEIDEKNTEITKLNEEMEKLKNKEHEWLNEKSNDEILATAYEKYIADEKEEAKNMVKSSLDRSKLTSIQQKVYDIIINDWFFCGKGVK